MWYPHCYHGNVIVIGPWFRCGHALSIDARSYFVIRCDIYRRLFNADRYRTSNHGFSARGRIWPWFRSIWLQIGWGCAKWAAISCVPAVYDKDCYKDRDSSCYDSDGDHPYRNYTIGCTAVLVAVDDFRISVIIGAKRGRPIIWDKKNGDKYLRYCDRSFLF